MFVVLLGLAAQQAAGVTAGDKIQIWIAVVTVLIVLLLFGYEQWAHWRPFRLLGSRTGHYSLAEDPRDIERIELEQGAGREFFLKIAPRVGGPCSDISATFLRRSSIRDRLKLRHSLAPGAHYVSPDVIDVEAIRIVTPSDDVLATKAKTTGNKDVYRLNPAIMLTPDEPLTCIVTARVGKIGWSGEFSARLKVAGVARGRVTVGVTTGPARD